MTTKELLERFFEEPLTTHGEQQADFLHAEALLIDSWSEDAVMGCKASMQDTLSDYRRSLEQGDPGDK